MIRALLSALLIAAGIALAFWYPQEAWALAPVSVTLALILIVQLLRSKAARASSALSPAHTSLDPWIFLYLISFTLSLFYRTSPGLYAQEICRVTALVVVYYVASWMRTDIKAFRAIIYVLIFIGGVIGILGVFKALAPWGVPFDPFLLRWNYRSHVQFSGLIAMAVGLTLGAALSVRSVYWKAALVFWLTGLLGIFAAAQSRAGWAAMIISFLTALMLVPAKNQKKLLAAGVFILLAMAIGAVFGHQVWTRIYDLLGGTDAAEIRLNVWRAAVRMIGQNWLLGSGPGMFQYDIMSYRPPGLNRLPEHAYNHWLEMTAAQGILVWPALAGITMTLFKNIIQSFRRAGDQKGYWQAGVAFGLLAVGLHDLFDYNFTVGINAALACVLAGWLQDRPGVGYEAKRGGLGVSRYLGVGLIAVICMVVTPIYGYSSWCLWRSEVIKKGPSSLKPSVRWHYASKATQILPWNAPAKRAKAQLITDLANGQSGSGPAKALWSKALAEWRSYLALNPRDMESHYLLAVALTGQNNGAVTPEALREMDAVIRERPGQKLPLTTSARYVLGHLPAAGGEEGIRWAEQRVAEAIRAFPGPESEWRLLNILYVFWIKKLPQPEAAEKIKIFLSQHHLGRDKYLKFLETNNLWGVYAKEDLDAYGLKIAGRVSPDHVAALRGEIAPSIELERIDEDWKEIKRGSLYLSFRVPAKIENGNPIKRLVVSASGLPCGGAPPYVRIEINEVPVAGFFIAGPDKQDYVIELAGELGNADTLRFTLVNAETYAPNPCRRSVKLEKVLAH